MTTTSDASAATPNDLDHPRTVSGPSARERLLAAADELFYTEGVQSVGVERILERAGVAKASLYKLFGDKDGLVLAYPQARHDGTTERLMAEVNRHRDPR